VRTLPDPGACGDRTRELLNAQRIEEWIGFCADLEDEVGYAGDSRVFLDAGTLCWPNGLELSPERVYEQSQIIEAA